MQRRHPRLETAAVPIRRLVLPGIDRPSHEYVYSTQYRMYLREGETFQLWMNPLLYMRQDTPGAVLSLTDSERRRFLVTLVQERLRKFLYVFLHAHALPELARVLFFLGDRSSDRLSMELRALDFLFRELRDYPEMELLESRRAIKHLLRNGRAQPSDLAWALAAFHREMDEIFAEEGASGTLQRVPEISEFDEQLYLEREHGFLRPLVDLSRLLRREGRGLVRAAYLLGSYATLDHVPGFSDVETLLVVNRETVTDPARLLRLRAVVADSMPHLYRMDPFQHHGHFVVSELDFDYYPQSFFPVPFFGGARAMLGGDSFQVRERESGFERRRAIWDLCYYSRRRHLEGARPRNFYEWKAQLGTVLLIPAAYLAARGEYCSKRDSFARVAPEFTPETWEIIDRASAIRRDWHWGRVPRLGFLARRASHDTLAGFWPWFAGHAGGGPSGADGTSGPEGVQSAFLFAETALGKLREEGVL